MAMWVNSVPVLPFYSHAKFSSTVYFPQKQSLDRHVLFRWLLLQKFMWQAHVFVCCAESYEFPCHVGFYWEGELLYIDESRLLALDSSR